MCGIAGLWRQRATLGDGDLVDAVARMNASQLHRGPDAGSLWRDLRAGLVLGQRRLAVVDLTPTGAQPMTARSGRWTITYNGELYGFGPLRSRLEASGHRFLGSSDTEVLLEAIDRWGVRAAVEAIDGMFAFAAWDALERRLHLVRDRFGEKPLCYGWVDGAFVFASETRAVRAAFPGRLTLDRAALAQFLELRCIPAPSTVHCQLRKVEPGGGVTVDARGAVTNWQYWSQLDRPGDPPLAPADALDAVEDALRTSVRDRLVADVPVGVFLSSGIDSSLVTALASEVSSEPVRTFTIGFADPAYDESASAAAIARRLGTRHTSFELTATDALSVVPDLPSLVDEPFADSSLLPTYLVSRLARESVTVALSGDGADELFAGYNRHRWLPTLWSRAARVPPSLRRPAAAMLRSIPGGWLESAVQVVPGRYRLRQPALKQQKLAFVVSAPSLDAMSLALARDWPVAPMRCPVIARSPFPPLPRALTGTRRAMALDVAHFLPNDVLTKVDRAAMAVSLETRAPYLARAVFDVACRLPDELLPPAAATKHTLKQLLDRRLPRELWDRPKTGFGIPLGSWLAGPLRPWVEDLVRSAALRDIGIDEHLVDRAWTDARRDPAGKAPYLVWNVVMLAGFLTRANNGTDVGSPATTAQE